MSTATVKLPGGMPANMKRLPTNEAGFPVPWFVPFVEGKADFRLMDERRLASAVRGQLCFICGQRLKRVLHSTAPRGTFVLGPMCVINRTGAEPPDHDDCAAWSAKACPFLTKPLKGRREANLPEGYDQSAGIAILRNPGVTALIDSHQWRVFRAPSVGASKDGVLFSFSRIQRVDWLCEGKEATAAQVLRSIETGLPTLIEQAEMDGLGAIPVLARRTRDALRWLPQGYTEIVYDYEVLTRLLQELR